MSDHTDVAPAAPHVPITDQASAFWKNWWALSWRLWIIAGLVFGHWFPINLLLLTGVGAAVLAFKYKKQVQRRAILGLLVARSPVQPLRETFQPALYRGPGNSIHTPLRTPPVSKHDAPRPTSTPAPSVPIVNAVSGPGRITGFEPRALDSLDTPTPAEHPLMHGTPGGGLSDSGFDKKAIELGQAGEVNFAKSLGLVGALDKYATFWSVDRPDWNGDRSGADVDCVVLTGSTVWLLDMKFYKGGDATYRSHTTGLYLYDNATGSQVGEPKKMSRNMEIADEVFSKMLDTEWRASGRFSVRSRVLLIPTNAGAPEIETGTAWPGGVRLENLDTFLTALSLEPAFDPGDRFGSTVQRGLRRLVKSTGKAA